MTISRDAYEDLRHEIERLEERCVAAEAEVQRLKDERVTLINEVDAAEKKESAITWLAAQMVVAMVAEDAERFHDGDFKSGVRAALEEIGVRFEMEARGEPSSGRGLLSTRAREALAAYDKTQ